MNMRMRIFQSFSFLLLVLVSSCHKQKSEWRGTIVEEDGVAVVNNPIDPLLGEFNFEIEQCFSLGNEEDENLFFFKVRDIEIDSENNLYVLDAGNYRIQKFSETGEYIQTIGGRGQGPGEFENPVSIAIDARDDIYVLDNRKISCFHKYGEYMSTIRLETDLSDIAITSQNYFIARVNPAKERKRALVKIDTDGKCIHKYAEYPDIIPSVTKGQTKGSAVIFTAFHDYSVHPFFSIIDDKKFIYGYPLEYELTVSDNSGDPLFKIRKEEKKATIQPAEKDYIISELEASIERNGPKWPKGALEEACRFPPHRPFFKDILVDEKKRLYVLRVMPVLNKNPDVTIDIYNEEGYYLYKSELAIVPAIIRNGFIYEIITVENTGEIKINKYIIKNRDIIKAEL